MYVPQRTWIEYGPQRRGIGALRLSIPVVMTPRGPLVLKPARGVGAAPCPSAQQLAGVFDPADPCQAASSSQCDLNTGIDPSTGQMCSQLVIPMLSGAETFPPTPGAASGMCLTPLFPWLGQKFAGVCAPVVSIPSPWGAILTAGLLGLVVLKFTRGR